MKTTRLKSGFVRVPHHIVRELSPAELQVWCAIQLHAPTYTVTVYTIAKDLQKDRSYMSAILRKLLEKGLVTAAPAEGHTLTLRYKAIIPDKSKSHK